MQVDEIINLLKNEQDGDELYSLLMNCGKRYELTKQQKEELKDTILEYCNHSDTIVRSAAIRVLCFYWGMAEFKDKAFQMFSDQTEDEGTQSDALMSWANIYRNTNNKETIMLLVGILKNTMLDVMIRSCAYRSIFNVSPIQSQDRPKTSLDWDNFDNEINWDLVNKILEEAK